MEAVFAECAIFKGNVSRAIVVQEMLDAINIKCTASICLVCPENRVFDDDFIFTSGLVWFVAVMYCLLLNGSYVQANT